MQSRFVWHLRRLTGRIWVPVVLYGLAAVLAALAAPVLDRMIPISFGMKMGAEAVEPILTIVATSMLAVTTFSLSIMVAAYSAAAGEATPRALRLLQDDRTAQRVLASFIGAFVYSLVGIVALSAGIHGDGGRFVLFAMTVGVIALIVVSLVRWVQHLTTFGRLTDTIARTERAMEAALRARLEDPLLGGHRGGPPPAGAHPVMATEVGYVQHIDIAAAARVAQAAQAGLWLEAMPGDLVHPARPLAHLVAPAGGRMPEAEDIAQMLRECYSIADRRTFDQDPEFGAIVLSEIASRALSPAVNDPGTAIDVLGRLVRVLSIWRAPARPAVRHRWLWVPPLEPAQILRVCVAPIGRDGAALREVMLHAIEALAALAAVAPEAFAAAARAEAERIVARARGAMALPEEAQDVADLAARRGLVAPPAEAGGPPRAPARDRA